MTLEKLKQYNGQNTKKAYIAYKGNVYDVSSSSLWENGIHKKIHQAGLDLTEAMEHAPHAEEVFANFKIVDTLDENDESNPAWVKWYRISFSVITLILGIVGIMIYLDDPQVVYLKTLPSILYHGIIFFTGMTVIILAHNGGKLTWPDKESS